MGKLSRNEIYAYVSIATAVMFWLSAILLHVVEEYPDDRELFNRKTAWIEIGFSLMFFGCSRLFYFSAIDLDRLHALYFSCFVQFLYCAVMILNFIFVDFRKIDPNNYPESMSYDTFTLLVNCSFIITILVFVLLVLLTGFLMWEAVMLKKNINRTV